MSKLAPYAKAVGAFLGGLTPAVLIGVLAVVHVSIDPTLAAALCTVLAAVGAYIAPSNKSVSAPAPVTPPEGGQHTA